MGGNTGIRILTAVGLAVALGGVRGVGPAAVAAFYVAAVTVPLVVTDVREQKLPNALVLPGYAFAALGLAWDALSRGSPGADAGAAVVGVVPVVAAGSGAVAVVAVVVGGVGVLGLFVLLAWTGGLGMGDAKLAGLLAIALGAMAPVSVAVPAGAVGALGEAGAAVPAGPLGAVAPLGIAVPVLVWVVAVFLAAALHGVIEGVVRRWSRGREALGRESRGSEALGNEAPGSEALGNEAPESEGPGSRRREVAFGPAMLGAFWMVVIAV